MARPRRPARRRRTASRSARRSSPAPRPRSAGTYGPFEVPEGIRAAWAEAGSSGRRLRRAWTERLAERSDERALEFERRIAGLRPQGLADAVAELKERLVAEPQTVATRKASEIALEVLTEAMPELVLGSADLTPSNNTKTKNLVDISPGQYGGRYIHYGIREHGMAAAMNGISLHGGFVPAGATFLVFTDYARPAMRIAALAGIPVIYVMTHDSIGLGEDGPTHQPVEHLAALRAMPRMRVFRPADAVETAECWQLALERKDGPTVLALTRQTLPQVRTRRGRRAIFARPAPTNCRRPTARRARRSSPRAPRSRSLWRRRRSLDEQSFAVRVVSVPSLDLFLAQPEAVRARIIGDAPVKVAVEAAVRFGWDALIGPRRNFRRHEQFRRERAL